MHATLTEVFLSRATESADRKAFSDERGSLTFGQTAAMARAVAASLDAISPGQQPVGGNVAILMPTVKEVAPAYYGVLLSGRTPVPLNFLLEPRELAVVLEDAEVDTVIASKVFEKLVGAFPLRVQYLEELTPEDVAAAAGYQATRRAAAGDVATLLYTSGTTGRPKGVQLTHENLVSNVEGACRAVHVTGEDSVLGVLPMFHSFAVTVTLNMVVAVGARVYFLPRFVPRRALELLQSEQVTVLPLVPSMFRTLIRSAARAEGLDHCIRLAMAGGEALPDDVARDFESVFGVPLLEGYGLTETSPILSFNRNESPRLGTVGHPLDNVEIGIFDDEGRRLGAGIDGEIWARGPSIMLGYRNRPEETAAVLDADGWFRTGDVGRLDEDGCLRITGRKKEMIISGGENIFPREIEDALTSHPAVFEAAVVGVPDKTRGELPYAFVAPCKGVHVTADELREHLRARLADYKVPRTIELRDELPHSPTGKLLKRDLAPGG